MVPARIGLAAAPARLKRVTNPPRVARELRLTSELPTILKMMAISLSLDTFGLGDLVVYFCACANVALTTPP